MIDLVQHVTGRPWAIQAEIAAHVRGLVAAEGIAGLRHLAQVKADIHAFDAQARGRRPSQPRGQAVAVIPVIGTLTQRGNVINSAMTRSTTDIVDEVQQATRDSHVGSLVLEVDSPGGEVSGVPEAWQAIREARQSKPVLAAVNSVAASAAYYLASAADEIWVTPSGSVGSIGVFALHVDASKALQDKGQVWTFVFAGKYKLEGNAAEPLGDEARAALQAEIDGYYEMFLGAVARGRGVAKRDVRYGFGEGRMVAAFQAVSEGMVDRVGPLQEAIRRAAQLATEDPTARAHRVRRETEADARELAARNHASRRLAKMDGLRVSSRNLTAKQQAWLAEDEKREQQREDARRKLCDTA